MSIQLSRTMHRYHFYLTNYYLLLIPDLANLYNFILFTYKIEIHFFYPLSNNKNFLFSSYKLSFVIGILIPDVTIKNSNYRILSILCLSQNWNPPNFFCVKQRYLPQIWKRRDESHKLTISNISIISEPIVHRPFDLSRFQEDSNVTIPRLDHVSSPRAGNSVSGEDTVQRTTKLFYATRSANSTIGSAPDPVFFALTNFACREAGWGREKFAGGTRRENVQQRGSQEIAAMSQTRLLILWLAAYEWRGEKNSKLSTRVTALRRMNLCVPQPCIRVYFFLDFLLSCEPMTRLIVAAIIALSSPITLFSCLFTYFFSIE